MVTMGAGANTWPSIVSTVDESDTRIWLHSRVSAVTKKIILSPDTDVYIQYWLTTVIQPTESVIIQLSRPSDKQLNLLNCNVFLDLLKRDPDLAHVREEHIGRLMQSIFVATGCDYISFFSGIGKAFFLKVVFENAKFITENLLGPFTGSISHSNLDEQALASQLTFIRLVGCA